ncbi:hypothetical protein PCC9214_04995 [Planktothrix tepida]|uniref:DUF6816 domain-containing protein n=2 Tax=Planktothrix TaxID=54304 RepID=A0A1J1LUW1_9CYAN|nr:MULTISPECIES: hypothetical protein [Planktothrix]CAD5917338.1 hypothetical protein NO713_00434 [Planktothrix pseudagardhii]CAD5982525.1 hypothetical protein PCC9214_04995 [Planktothrix tepida]CUR35810.1 conserved exported hypothetical protein [Planktothrix tepida PCC 9214]
MKKLILIVGLILGLILGETDAQAGELAERLSEFPNWTHKPMVKVAEGDLFYPEWMEGEWDVTSTLVDKVAPLAPQISTPGFEKNSTFMNQPIEFKVRFKTVQLLPKLQIFPLTLFFTQEGSEQHADGKIYPKIVSDRAFNGFNMGRAILGENGILSVKVDPTNPNRLITALPGNLELVSTVTGRSREIPSEDQFIASEISQQVFESSSQIYFNEVETTTAYKAELDAPVKSIVGDQVTAVYLSPQDPNFFTASGHPVALYRYKLKLVQKQ